MSMDRKEVAQQFQTLAEVMEELPQEQLTSMILTSCVYLLEQLGDGTKPLDQMSALERSEIMGGYSQVSDCVDRFAQQVRSQLGSEAVIRLHERSMEQLQQEKERAQQLQTEQSGLQEQIRQLQQDNQQQLQLLQQQEQELTELQEVHTNQQARLRLCDATVVQAAKDRNDTLEKQLEQLESDMAAETRKKEALEEKVRVVESAIAQIPQQQRVLVDELLEREAYLARLQTAEHDCSTENQQKLKEQIEELEPRVTKLEADTKKLREILLALQAGHTLYDDQLQTLSTDVLEVIDEQLGALQVILPDHREALLQAKECTEKMQKSLAECKQLAEGYRSWFDQDRRPLEAWKKAIRAPEYAQLQQVLDLNQCSRVQVLTAQIEQALQDLDQLLVECNAAIRKDQKNIERKANGR